MWRHGEGSLGGAADEGCPTPGQAIGAVELQRARGETQCNQLRADETDSRHIEKGTRWAQTGRTMCMTAVVLIVAVKAILLEIAIRPGPRGLRVSRERPYRMPIAFGL